MRGARRGWAAFAAALAIVSWGGVSHERERALHGAGGAAEAGRARAGGPGDGGGTVGGDGTTTPRTGPLRAIDAVRADLTDDSDARRYCAYANAALGRPYQAHYVRTLREWLSAFAAGTPGDPDAAPVLQPPGPLVPNRDYLVEYPPGFFLWALPPALVARTPAGYAAVFFGMMAALLALSLLLCVRLAAAAGLPGRAAGELPAWSALAVLALGAVATHRYDASVALLLCATAWAAAARRPALCGAALGVAVATKLTPVLVAPLLVAYFAPDRRALVRFTAAAALTALALFAPALALAPQGTADMLRYHAQRPLQLESTPAALLGVARAFAPGLVAPERSYGSSNLAGAAVGPMSKAFAVLGALALLGALGLGALRIARAAPSPLALAPPPPARVAALIDGMLAVLIALMAFGKVFSPQYLVWILPLGLLAALARSRWHAALLVALLAATQAIYPFSYGALSRLEPWICALVLARNALFIALAVLLLLPPAGRARPAERSA